MNFNVYRISMVKEKSIEYQSQISNSKQVAEVIRKTITECGQNDREQMVVVMLDVQNQIIGTNIVSIGSLSEATVCLRELFKPVILANSHALVVGHNHPSGNLKPSCGDNNFTERLFSGACMLDITLHDHVIISTESKKYYSYADNGIMENFRNKKKMELPIIATTVNKDYFKNIVGRKPHSESELADFAYSIEKGVKWSIDWGTVNDNARNSVE